MDFAAVDRKIAALEACIANPVPVSADEPLFVGVDLGTVLEANVAKLAGRAERGTLRGNGDHR